MRRHHKWRGKKEINACLRIFSHAIEVTFSGISIVFRSTDEGAPCLCAGRDIN
jgi:hypothetical protein